MSNVSIRACGDEGLEVSVILGAQTRNVVDCPAGEETHLAVGGGQYLEVRTSKAVAPTAEPTVAEGVDVSPDPAPADANSDAASEPVAGGVDPAIANYSADSGLETGDPLSNPFDPDAG